MVTKEAVEKRLFELRKILEQIHANGNATVGAITECEYWLNQFYLEEDEKSKNKDSLI